MFKKSDWKPICNTTIIGSWEEVQAIPASTITKSSTDTGTLDGLLVRGYEMKFGAKNENWEVYSKDAFTKYIENYFVKNKINIPVDLQHYTDLYNTCGRVIYAEVNTTGLYFVAYIPKGVAQYEDIKFKLKEGILQGFSKYGWATDYTYKYDNDGNFDYMQINEFQICSVSIVSTPANAVTFEKMQEIKNATTFVDNTKKKKKFFK